MAHILLVARGGDRWPAALWKHQMSHGYSPDVVELIEILVGSDLPLVVDLDGTLRSDPGAFSLFFFPSLGPAEMLLRGHGSQREQAWRSNRTGLPDRRSLAAASFTAV